MDNPKIHDTQLNNRTKCSVLALLDSKQLSTPTRKASINSLDTDIQSQPASRMLPTYSFTIKDYSIGQHVEYSVLLVETYKIFRKNITKSYSFRTRYSKLEMLDERLGGMGLPAKKWFGSRSVEFVERRRGELERYLNGIAGCKRTAFLQFVKQIKDGEYNRSLKEKFSIE